MENDDGRALYIENCTLEWDYIVGRIVVQSPKGTVLIVYNLEKGKPDLEKAMVMRYVRTD